MTTASSPDQPPTDPTTGGAWAAPCARAPVGATVRVPGSKSATNRALLLAALGEGESTLLSPLDSRDTRLMAHALRSLGSAIEAETGAQAEASWRVVPGIWRRGVDIDCGLAGTVMRFVPAAATLARATVSFDGDTAARKRPMLPLLSALRQLGADVADAGGYLPFRIHGTGALAGGEATIDASSSSQFVSALLLAAPRFEAGISLRNTGSGLPSAPHIAMTVAMLRDAGVDVDDSEPGTWTVAAGSIAGRTWNIEPDLSNAAPFLAAALVTDGEVTVAGWPEHTLQPGDSLRGILTQLGGTVEFTADGLTVRGGDRITGIDIDLHDVGELTPVIAALCALATSPSRLRGIAHLRGHETDRLAALVTELGRFGCDVAETEDGLAIDPRPLRPETFATYHDHRMAQAGAVIGLAVPGTRVENIATTGKTMPAFPEMWEAMLSGTSAAAPAAVNAG